MLESMADSMATVADVQQLVTTLHDSMLQLHEQSSQKVL